MLEITEKNHRKLQSGQLASWLRFELGTLQIQFRNVTG